MPSVNDIYDIISIVKAEVERATNKYKPFHSAHEGFAILKEEVDELWSEVKLKQSDPSRPQRMAKEAIQVAAMAIRFLYDLIPYKVLEQIVNSEK